MSNEKLKTWHKKKELDHIACYSYTAYYCALIIEKVFFVVVLSNLDLEDADSVDEHLLAQK